jgi:hypothetical protein
VDLDALSEPQLERLYAGLVRLASIDATVLSALVEQVLAGDEPASSTEPAYNEACRSEGWHPPDAGTPARGTHCRASSSAGVATARGGFRQACIPTKTRRRREFFRGPGLGAVAAGRSGWGGVSGG